MGPGAVASLWFVLEYAQLNRFLTLYNRFFLILFVTVGTVMILTNNNHHWIWLDFSFNDGSINPLLGSGFWTLIITGLVLVFLNVPILIWLFIRSPQQRWPVALIFCGQLIFRTGFVIETIYLIPNWNYQLTILGLIIVSTTYSIALFSFRIFDPVAVAREMVVDQMHVGMLVVDPNGEIIDMNPAVEKIFGLSKAYVCGKKTDDVMHLNIPINHKAQPTEMSVVINDSTRHYELNSTPLQDQCGVVFGQLILLHDVTNQKLTQKKILEQQRALASLEERQNLARELHDQLAQELAFLNIQAQAAFSMLESDQNIQAKAAMLHLSEIALQTQIDVRELISFLINPGSIEGHFLASLRQSIVVFNQKCSIHMQLHLPSDTLLSLNPIVEVQLLRIIQEGLTNIRKHANAKQAQLTITPSSDQLEVVIEDDGDGFDADNPAGEGAGYGLYIMRDRAAAIKADLHITSAPGEGARIHIRVPLRSDAVVG